VLAAKSHSFRKTTLESPESPSSDNDSNIDELLDGGEGGDRKARNKCAAGNKNMHKLEYIIYYHMIASTQIFYILRILIKDFLLSFLTCMQELFW
jgi:hypothetical protein